MKHLICTIAMVIFLAVPALAWGMTGNEELTGIILTGDIIRNFTGGEVEAGLGFIYEGSYVMWVPFSGNNRHGELFFQSGVLYQYYPAGNAAGFFAGGGTRLALDYRKEYEEKELVEHTYFITTPQLLAGYRFNYSYLTAALRVELGYDFARKPELTGPYKGIFLEFGIIMQP